MAGSRTLKLSILADIDNLKKNLNEGDKEIQGFGGKLEKFGKVAAAAFAAAAAAAAAYAVKLAVDGVKAAIEDEAAQLRLANALRNVTGATDAQIAAIEEQILKMSLAFGVADDQLRPAFQRLAIATGDLGVAQKGLGLALDISAATGKNLDTVANALSKAYEGNTGALGRLGVGLSAAEIKTLGLDGTMKQLAATFGGAATVQANTLEGQIARLKTLFAETQESVGQGLLPAVKAFMDYITNRFIPMLIEAKNKALDPIKKAFADNREELQALWQFTKTYVVPLFEVILVNAVKRVGEGIAAVTNIIGAVIRGIESLINKAIDMINSLINKYNSLPDWLQPSGDIRTISRVDFSPNSDARVGGVQLPFGGQSVVPTTSPVTAMPGAGTTGAGTITGAGATTTGATTGREVITAAQVAPVMPTLQTAVNTGRFIGPGISLDPDMVAPRVTVNVSGAIDPSSVARQIAEILNDEAASSGSFTLLGANRFAAIPV